jgi:hypothetical protein
VERAYLSVSAFVGEFGPSKTGKTICGFEFTSKDPCYICGEVHDGAALRYRVALVSSGCARCALYSAACRVDAASSSRRRGLCA